MSKKQEFIKYVRDLMDYTRKMDIPPMNDEAEMYWNAFTSEKEVEKWEEKKDDSNN